MRIFRAHGKWRKNKKKKSQGSMSNKKVYHFKAGTNLFHFPKCFNLVTTPCRKSSNKKKVKGMENSISVKNWVHYPIFIVDGDFMTFFLSLSPSHFKLKLTPSTLNSSPIINTIERWLCRKNGCLIVRLLVKLVNKLTLLVLTQLYMEMEMMIMTTRTMDSGAVKREPLNKHQHHNQSHVHKIKSIII